MAKEKTLKSYSYGVEINHVVNVETPTHAEDGIAISPALSTRLSFKPYEDFKRSVPARALMDKKSN